MTASFEVADLSHRYGRAWALRGCSFQVPQGCVTALVGPNGAGKTTLLEIAVGIIEPTAGDVRVLGTQVRGNMAALLNRVGFVAQDAPLYRHFTVVDMLRFGRHMNPHWDGELARSRLEHLGIPLHRQCGRLSGGQQAQVALTLALAKRPEILILDEPVARLDPLARREFLESLMEVVADGGVTVLLSSHLISDLERVSDHLVLISKGRVLVAGSIEHLLTRHHVVSGPRETLAAAEGHLDIVNSRVSQRQATFVVRGDAPLLHPAVTCNDVDLEELVLAYLRGDGSTATPEDRLLIASQT